MRQDAVLLPHPEHDMAFGSTAQAKLCFAQLEAPFLPSLLHTLSVLLWSSHSEDSKCFAASLNSLPFHSEAIPSWLDEAIQNQPLKPRKHISLLWEVDFPRSSAIANTISLNRAKFLKAELGVWIPMASRSFRSLRTSVNKCGRANSRLACFPLPAGWKTAIN